MPSCNQMKKGEVYKCPGCGIEMQVVAECENIESPEAEHSCHTEGPCVIACCGCELEKS